MKMKISKEIFLMTFLGALLVFASTSSAKEEVQSADEAITSSQAQSSLDAKVNYLIFHGKELMDREKYTEAKEIAEYVLNKLEGTSEEARQLLERAEARILDMKVTGEYPKDVNY